jgi:hypothetical protein
MIRRAGDIHLRQFGVFASFAVALLLVPALGLAQTSKSGLGTLFYSPEERAAIIAARLAQAGGVVASGTMVSVGGIVRRAAGKGTAWINGQVVAEGQAIASAGVPVIEPRRIVVDGHPVKVRETVDIESGLRSDALPLGAVIIKKQK